MIVFDDMIRKKIGFEVRKLFIYSKKPKIYLVCFLFYSQFCFRVAKLDATEFFVMNIPN